ncbi:MAG: hypothetical protein AAB538_04315 [Patescibacteria group bacterium]
MKFTSGSLLAGLALAVAIIALIVGVVALRRPGTLITGPETNFKEQIGIITARARSEARLKLVQAQLVAKEGYDDAATQVQDIRADLRGAYAEAKEESKQEWVELDKDLEQLEVQIRDKSADALQTLENILTRLRQEVRTDD